MTPTLDLNSGAEYLSDCFLDWKRSPAEGLRCLFMSGTDLSADGVESLCKGLCNMSTLESLELDNSHLDYSPTVRL